MSVKFHTEKTKIKISVRNKGRKLNDNTKSKISLSKIGDKNPMWKGDSVGYEALHDWVKRRLPKPTFCQNCHKNYSYDLANKSGKYLRDLLDWEWLCRKCHMFKDGRSNKLASYSKNKKLENKNCIICNKNFHPKRLSAKYCSFNCYWKYKKGKPIDFLYKKNGQKITAN